jgi:superoxide dismutase, Cu-Zn family
VIDDDLTSKCSPGALNQLEVKMKKLIMGILALGLAAFAVSGAQTSKAVLRYADVAGAGPQGTFVFVTMPDGTHNAFLHLTGLKPSATVYANHIHYNDKGDAKCDLQNGDKLLPLNSVTADKDGNATVFTTFPASAKYPAGSTYYNIHSNDPTAVGPSIACGDMSMGN